uniref:Gamma-glutamylcyclotransferase family protein n=2 Tax=Macrostomum lignano TaxID=282301 RepID=A0A1I8HWA7_9PLAT
MSASSNIININEPIKPQLPLHLFVYGTLKFGQPNQHVLLGAGGEGGAVYVSGGRTLESYPLVISSSANIPFLLNRPGLGHRIFGHIVCVRTLAALSTLDEFEACPELYQRLSVPVEALPAPESDWAVKHAGCSLPVQQPGQTVFCQIYVYSGPDEKLLRLPHLADYRSDGDHGRPYLAEVDDVASPEQLEEHEKIDAACS